MTLHYLDMTEMHASDSKCDIDGGSDSQGATDQEVPMEPKSKATVDHKSTKCHFPLHFCSL